MLLSIHPQNPQKHKIDKAVKILKQGGTIAYPTGTVIGFGCDLFNKKAIEKLRQLKNVDKKKKFSFLCADLKEIARYAVVNDNAYRIMKRLVPGPYTFILKATKEVPKLCMDRRKTVGIRVPTHKVALMILEELGRPIISTSATRDSDDWMSNDPEEIACKFKDLDIVIDSGMGGMTPSTVLSFDDDGNIEVLREGSGPIDDIF